MVPYAFTPSFQASASCTTPPSSPPLTFGPHMSALSSPSCRPSLARPLSFLTTSGHPCHPASHLEMPSQGLNPPCHQSPTLTPPNLAPTINGINAINCRLLPLLGTPLAPCTNPQAPPATTFPFPLTPEHDELKLSLFFSTAVLPLQRRSYSGEPANSFASSPSSSSGHRSTTCHCGS
jgi:hypothetical protein